MDKQKINGRDWYYDSEMGVYRPADPPESLWSKWGWVVCVIVLSLVCWLLD